MAVATILKLLFSIGCISTAKRSCAFIRETTKVQTQEFKRPPPFPLDPVAALATELERISDADLVERYFEELTRTD